MPIFLKIFYGFYPIRDLIFFLLVLMPLKKSVFVQKKGDAGGMKTGGLRKVSYSDAGMIKI